MDNSNLGIESSEALSLEEELQDTPTLIEKPNIESDLEIDYKPPSSPSASDLNVPANKFLSTKQTYEDLITKLSLLSKKNKKSTVMSQGTVMKAIDNSSILFSIGDGIEESDISSSEQSSHVLY